MMRSTLAAIGLLAVLACGAATARAADETKGAVEEKAKGKDYGGLVGKWKVKAIRDAGQEAPGDKIPDIFVTFYADGKVEGELPNGAFKATFHVDLESNPKALDFKHVSGPHAGEPQFCSYKLDGDLFTILASAPGAEANDRPLDFDKERSYVFERVKEDKKP